MEIDARNITAWIVDGSDWTARRELGEPPLTEENRRKLSPVEVGVLIQGLKRGYVKIDRGFSKGQSRLRAVSRNWKPGDNFWLIDGGEIKISF